MVTVAIVALVVLVLLAGVALFVRRSPGPEPGVASFRRHIDALSPEARREVMDRVRGPMNPQNGSDD